MLETGGREHCTQRAARGTAYRLGRRWLPRRNGDSESRKRWAHCIQFYNRKPLKDLSRKALAFLSLKCYSSYCMGKKETGVCVWGGKSGGGKPPSEQVTCPEMEGAAAEPGGYRAELQMGSGDARGAGGVGKCQGHEMFRLRTRRCYLLRRGRMAEVRIWGRSCSAHRGFRAG